MNILQSSWLNLSISFHGVHLHFMDSLYIRENIKKGKISLYISSWRPALPFKYYGVKKCSYWNPCINCGQLSCGKKVIWEFEVLPAWCTSVRECFWWSHTDFCGPGVINMSLFNGQTQLALLASKSVNQHHRAGGQDKIVHWFRYR